MNMPYRTVTITDKVSADIFYDETLSNEVGEDHYVALVNNNNEETLFEGFAGVDEAEDFLINLFEVKNEV